MSNNVIKKAYELYLKDLGTNERIKELNELDTTLEQFHKKLRGWKATDSVDFIVDFALSREASIFASAGLGVMATEDFKEFMNMKNVKEKLQNLIHCKFNSETTIIMQNEIRKNDLKKYLDSGIKEDNISVDRRPRQLVGRLLLMMFPEIYTTIADETTLNDVYTKITNESSKGKDYLSKQRKVRFEVDKFLEENNLTNEVNNMTKTGLAWWISQV